MAVGGVVWASGRDSADGVVDWAGGAWLGIGGVAFRKGEWLGTGVARCWGRGFEEVGVAWFGRAWL